jgi:signal transduction histidine kinase
MASGTGAAAEKLSFETTQRRRADVAAAAPPDRSGFHRCARELRSLLRARDLGVAFFFEDRGGRLRSTFRVGGTADRGRRPPSLRRQTLIDGRTRLLQKQDGRLVGFFPIDGLGGVIGVVEVSTSGMSLRHRRRDVERTIVRFSERLQRDADRDRQRRTLDIGLAWMAHELRGPLLAARLSLENAADGIDPASARSLVRAADELSRLAAGLDSILHVATGNGTIRRRPVDLPALVRDAAGCCVAESGDDRVMIRGIDRLAVIADPLHLRSAIENVIRNALRYSTAGSTVLVTVEPRKDDVVVEVQNEGPGIAPDDRERIFEPLVKGRSGSGAGIGLFVARRVIERHGGTIRYREPRDGLSAFELRFPTRESA